MAVYSMGAILKKCRETKGITQEELCYGICTPSALSKIEHGLREPSYVKFASLMERMGEWPRVYDVFIGDKVYLIQELQSDIRKQIFHGDFATADKILDKLEKELENFPNETVYHQFLKLERIICRSNGRIQKKQINELIMILKWTVPFEEKPIYECFLSHQELNLINNIAVGYGENGELEKAIQLLGELKEYLENHYMGNRTKATMYSTVLLNQVKYLGLGEHYEKALEVANEAIDILVEIGKTLDIATLHYDIAWIYTKMDREKYRSNIEDEIMMSLYADLSNRNYHSANETLNFIENNIKDFGLNFNSLHHFWELYHRVAPAHCPKQILSE